jgi:hypothetical protein
MPLFFPKIVDIYLCQEEDLFIMSYGLPLNEDGNERCLALLNAVEETLCRQLRACKTTSSKRRVSEGICLLKLETSTCSGEVLYYDIVVKL